jgi:hypothetical protein
VVEPPTLAAVCPRPAAPDRHPPKEAVPLALSSFAVLRPASTVHGQPTTRATGSTT